MRVLILAVPLLLLGLSAEAREVQLLDPGIFGHRTTDPIKLLSDKKGDEIEPHLVQVDIRCGEYRAATVTYPKAATFAEVKTSLDALYGESPRNRDSGTGLALWRVEKQRVAISLSVEDGASRVIYIAFLTMREGALHMMEAFGGDRAVIDGLLDGECVESAATTNK